MRSWILGAVLASGMTLAQTTPADAQVTFSLGRSPGSPSVTLGQPAYNSGYYPGAPATGYYGQPATNGGYYTSNVPSSGYYVQPTPNTGYYGRTAQSNVYTGQPVYAAPRYSYSPGRYVPAYPSATTYGSGYQGYAPTPGYYPGNSAYPGYGYGNQGVNLNVPGLGPVNVR